MWRPQLCQEQEETTEFILHALGFFFFPSISSQQAQADLEWWNSLFLRRLSPLWPCHTKDTNTSSVYFAWLWYSTIAFCQQAGSGQPRAESYGEHSFLPPQTAQPQTWMIEGKLALTLMLRKERMGLGVWLAKKNEPSILSRVWRARTGLNRILPSPCLLLSVCRGTHAFACTKTCTHAVSDMHGRDPVPLFMLELPEHIWHLTDMWSSHRHQNSSSECIRDFLLLIRHLERKMLLRLLSSPSRNPSEKGSPS